MTTRIYTVTHKIAGSSRLVRAHSQAQALRYAAQSEYGVRVASQDDIVGMMSKGVAVESAGAEQMDLVGEAQNG